MNSLTIWVLVFTFNLGPEYTDKHRFYATREICEAQTEIKLSFEEGGKITIKKPCFKFTARHNIRSEYMSFIRGQYSDDSWTVIK